MLDVSSLNKYINTHPYISPEAFKTHLYEPGVVRALYISHQYKYSSYIVTDKPDNLLSSVFLGDSYDLLYPDIYYHVCYSVLTQSMTNKPNYVATTLIRNSYLTSTGVAVADAIYGDVLVFGSYNYEKRTFDDQHYSVPYEIVEQVFRIDATKTSTQPFA